MRRPGFDPWVRKIPWRRKWQPTPLFLPGESHGRWNLAGYSPWGRKELDTTERLHFTSLHFFTSSFVKKSGFLWGSKEMMNEKPIASAPFSVTPWLVPVPGLIVKDSRCFHHTASWFCTLAWAVSLSGGPSFWTDYFLFMVQMVKTLPAMWKTWVWFLGWDDSLEKGTATHSSILAWRIPWIV